MNFKNIKLRQKFFMSFGLIVLLLIGTAMWSIYGIGGIIDNGEEVIDGNKLRNGIILRNLDHVKWVNQVDRFINDDDVTELHAETDPHKCKFGKWYYGDGRTNVF